jgi:hypothetical protein
VKYKINYATAPSVSEQREIITIDDLKRLSEENGNNALLIDFGDVGEQPTITIYDGYIE